LSIIAKTSANIVKVIPDIPAIPNPGIIKISAIISRIPAAKRRISQFSAKPSR
jgi:hypothetical protein